PVVLCAQCVVLSVSTLCSHVLILLSSYGQLPDLHSFPTRRSSDLNDSQKYLIDLSGIVENSDSEVSLFYFDITMNPLYLETGRSGEIIAKVHGNSFRYSKNTNKLTIHYQAE